MVFAYLADLVNDIPAVDVRPVVRNEKKILDVTCGDNNRRNTVYITIDGVTKTLAEWADFAGIKRSVMADRYFCKAIRGVALLHKVEDTRFKKGYNRYKFEGHWETDAPTIIPAESITAEEEKWEKEINKVL